MQFERRQQQQQTDDIQRRPPVCSRAGREKKIFCIRPSCLTKFKLKTNKQRSQMGADNLRGFVSDNNNSNNNNAK